MPNLYIISGCNGAGKTTASYSLLPEMLNCSQFVNSDEFAKSLSPFDPGHASISASKFMIKKIIYLFKRQEDFAIETTLATRTLLKTIRLAQKNGYKVTILYLWLNSPELALSRVAARVDAGGHNIPKDTITRRYFAGLNYLFNDYMPLCDRWILADNSEIPFKVIAEGKPTEIVVKDCNTFEKIRKIASVNWKISWKNSWEEIKNKIDE